MRDLAYVADKISRSPLIPDPFPHIYIESLFNESDFREITEHSQINLQTCASDRQLLDLLLVNGWQAVYFPGCTPNHEEYLERHDKKEFFFANKELCEGFGMTFRLTKIITPELQFVTDFFGGKDFVDLCCEKFKLSNSELRIESGIHKYLDGYEISPHPDIRKKALTFMININPHPFSENFEYHTHYMKFKKKYQYISTYWQNNPEADRCWVPWDWCESHFRQSTNNSMTLFAPSNISIHAVKAAYNHLTTQRTQIYGNLWHHKVGTTFKPTWQDFDIMGKSSVAGVCPAGHD